MGNRDRCGLIVCSLCRCSDAPRKIDIMVGNLTISSAAIAHNRRATKLSANTRCRSRHEQVPATRDRSSRINTRLYVQSAMMDGADYGAKVETPCALSAGCLRAERSIRAKTYP